ncbi:MAG: dihydrofolate reductase [Planctomycetota bacterium]
MSEERTASKKRPLTMIVAATPDGVIGRDGDMPWRLSSDLRRFKRHTMGGTLIMGRRTFESIGKPLPGRETIVVSRRLGATAEASPLGEGVRVVSGPSEALMSLDREKPAFLVGGGQLYEAMLDDCDWVEWTVVHSQVEGDTRIDVSFEGFELLAVSRFIPTDRDSVPTTWCRLRRVGDRWSAS